MLTRRQSIGRRWLLACLTIVAALVVSGLTLADEENDSYPKCDFRGSWYGYLPTLQLDFMSMITGTSASHGTYVLEVPGFELTALGAVKTSSFRGTWERLDKNSIAFTLISYGVDTIGQTTVIVKISGIDTISNDCNTMSIENTNEIFSGVQDPFGNQAPAFGYVLGGKHAASRMRVDPPAEPL